MGQQTSKRRQAASIYDDGQIHKNVPAYPRGSSGRATDNVRDIEGGCCCRVGHAGACGLSRTACVVLVVVAFAIMGGLATGLAIGLRPKKTDGPDSQSNTVPDGQPCSTSSDCLTSATAAVNSTCFKFYGGSAETPESRCISRLPDGAECASGGNGDDCLSGGCERIGGEWRCLTSEGQPCSGPGQCAESLSCASADNFCMSLAPGPG